jgi:hypothetical protein
LKKIEKFSGKKPPLVGEGERKRGIVATFKIKLERSE